jgi:hypothetical protein
MDLAVTGSPPARMARRPASPEGAVGRGVADRVDADAHPRRVALTRERLLIAAADSSAICAERKDAESGSPSKAQGSTISADRAGRSHGLRPSKQT